MKGSVLDVIIVPIVAFVLIITVMFTYMFLDQFNTIAQTALPAEASAFVEESLQQFLFFDQIIIILIGGLFIVSLIGAAMINAHPIFFVASIMILIVFIFASSLITNIFWDIANNEALVATANLFPLTVQFFQNLPLFMTIFTIMVAIVAFSFGGRNVSY